MSYDEPGYVSEQYHDASNLGARTALHECFSTNRNPWQRWVFDAFDLPSEAPILEVGCGELAARGGIHVTKDTGMFVVRK